MKDMRIQVVLHKQKNFAWPIAETDTHWIIVGLDKDLNVAMTLAARNAIKFLATRAKLGEFDQLRPVQHRSELPRHAGRRYRSRRARDDSQEPVHGRASTGDHDRLIARRSASRGCGGRWARRSVRRMPTIRRLLAAAESCALNATRAISRPWRRWPGNVACVEWRGRRIAARNGIQCGARSRITENSHESSQLTLWSGRVDCRFRRIASGRRGPERRGCRIRGARARLHREAARTRAGESDPPRRSPLRQPAQRPHDGRGRTFPRPGGGVVEGAFLDTVPALEPYQQRGLPDPEDSSILALPTGRAEGIRMESPELQHRQRRLSAASCGTSRRSTCA